MDGRDEIRRTDQHRMVKLLDNGPWQAYPAQLLSWGGNPALIGRLRLALTLPDGSRLPVTARLGASVAVAGSAGDDTWGRWLRGQLAAAGVDVSRFVLVAGKSTPRARVTVDAAGDPGYALVGSPVGLALDGLPAAVSESRGLFIGSNTLVSAADRAATMSARAADLSI